VNDCNAKLLLSEIDKALMVKNRLLIAIDGRCGAGKSTLAASIKYIRGCNVIPMDHFFLRPEQRTAGRLEEPGGNIDHERFYNEALIPLKQGVDFSYRPYDCRIQKLLDLISIKSCSINIVEGTYSCHPSLIGYYDLRIFMSVEKMEQLRRIEQRNGEAGVSAFANKWIPLEELYFSTYKIEERCDLFFV
jgi:uridine kinase